MDRALSFTSRWLGPAKRATFSPGAVWRISWPREGLRIRRNRSAVGNCRHGSLPARQHPYRFQITSCDYFRQTRRNVLRPSSFCRRWPRLRWPCNRYWRRNGLPLLMLMWRRRAWLSRSLNRRRTSRPHSPSSHLPPIASATEFADQPPELPRKEQPAVVIDPGHLMRRRPPRTTADWALVAG